MFTLFLNSMNKMPYANSDRRKSSTKRFLIIGEGCLSHDAVTFWEEYDPTQTGNENYSMYGILWKSLCHAWGASPIYLLGHYFIGLYPTKPGYERIYDTT